MWVYKLDSLKIVELIEYYSGPSYTWLPINFPHGFNKSNCFIFVQDVGNDTKTSVHIKLHDNNDKFTLTSITDFSVNVRFLFLKRT